MTDTSRQSAPFCGDDHDPAALSANAARQGVLEGIRSQMLTATEHLPLLQSLDRVLAADIIATLNVPPHDNSAMDGYALRSGDLPDIGSRELQVAGSSFAGHPFQGICNSGECVRIMTGAVLPAELDTVIPQELVQTVSATTIRIDAGTRPGDNTRKAGEDIMQGQTVLERGRRIGAADLGLLASLGIPQVCAFRRLRVAFFSTGDELRSVGEALHAGEIYDSNRYALFAMLKHQHCRVTDLGVVRDDPAMLRKILLQAALDHDVLISSGGVSVGEADYVRQVLSESGNIAFWKVAMKPGRPFTFGHLGNTVFFGLPGNPVAMMVSFCQFVQPALQYLAGETPSQPLTLTAVTTSALKKRAGRTEYQRGILSVTADGSLTVSKTGNQGSGILLSMSRANCFIILSADQTHVAAGSNVRVQPFFGLL